MDSKKVYILVPVEVELIKEKSEDWRIGTKRVPREEEIIEAMMVFKSKDTFVDAMYWFRNLAEIFNSILR